MREMLMLLLLLSLTVMSGHQVMSQEDQSKAHHGRVYDGVTDQTVDLNILAGQCHMISSIQNSMIQVMSAHYEFEKGIHSLHNMMEQTNQDISDLKGHLVALEEKVLEGPPDSHTIHKDDLMEEKALIKLLTFFEGFMSEGLKENETWLKSHRLAPDFLHFVANVSDALDFQQERADFLYRRLHSLRRQVRKLAKSITPPKVLTMHPQTNQLTTDSDLLQKMVVQQQDETDALKARVMHLEMTLKGLLKKQNDDARQFVRSDTQFLEDCPPGFVRHRSSCYRFINHTDNWIDAEKHCQSLHPFSHLVAIETKDEEDFIHLYRRHNAAKWTSYYMWLGGSDMFLENSWVWIGTYSSLSYTNWLPGQPSNQDNEQHCIYFRTEGSDRRWDDWNCYGARMNYVCEIIIHAL